MTLTFDTIKLNKEKVEKLMEMFPQVQEHFNGNLSWDYMVNSGLNEISNGQSIFNRFKDKLDLLLGNTSISFETLKELMVDKSKEMYKDSVKLSKTDHYDNRVELIELKDVKKLVKKVTESEFKSMFETDDLHKLFPYLYRLEVNLAWEFEIEIFNYLVTNKVELHENILNSVFDFEPMVDEYDVDYDEVKRKMGIFEKSEKITQKILELLKQNEKEIDLKYIKTQISRV